MKKVKDYYYKKAKKEKYPARSVYKLEEIQQKYRILKPGDRVLDLGCLPGSWTLFAARTIGAKGL
ncbi:MAG: RlmE family RNA methyltransferase, partial [Desulfobulbaceae bacterium]|nr:RlmE family RNA methyltransferase [Desulfobulbaceae bacterium]